MDISTFLTFSAIKSSQSSLQQNVNISLLKKVMDTSEIDSSELIRSMQQSVQPQIGNKLDLKA